MIMSKKTKVGQDLIHSLEEIVYKNIRSLDVEIATKVLNQTIKVYESFSGSYDYTLISGTSFDKFGVLNDYTEEYDVPHYSTNIYWAYAIMNYMISKKYDFTLSSDWTVTISKNNQKSIQVQDSSLPLAIVKSILIMKDYENKERNKVLSK